MKNLELLEKRLAKEGYEIRYGEYNGCCGRFNNIEYVYNKELDTKTFLVVDYFYNRSYTIISLKGANRSYKQIIECIKEGYENLGRFDDDRKGFGVKKDFMPWEVEE